MIQQHILIHEEKKYIWCVQFYSIRNAIFLQSIVIRFASLFYIQKHRKARTVNEYLFIKLFVTVAPSSAHAYSHFFLLFLFSSGVYIFFFFFHWVIRYFRTLSVRAFDLTTIVIITQPIRIVLAGCCFSLSSWNFIFILNQDTKKKKKKTQKNSAIDNSSS